VIDRRRQERRLATLVGTGAAAASLVTVAFARPNGVTLESATADRWSSSTVDIAHALAREPDGKLVAAGLSSRFGHYEAALARYGPDGKLDRGFGTGGRVLTDFGSGGNSAYLNALAIQPDGKIVAAGGAGISTRGSGFAIVRYTLRGRLDAGFGRGGQVLTRFGPARVASDASALAIQPDGKIVAAGSTSESLASGPTHIALVRYTSRGRLDPTFGSGGRVTSNVGSKLGDVASTLAIQADGKLVVAGTAFLAKDIDLEVARFTIRGKLDPSFGQGGRVLTHVSYAFEARSVVVQPDGKLVVAGTAGAHEGFGLVRYTPGGKLDPTFGSGGTVVSDFDPFRGETLGGLALQPDGKLVAAGTSEGTGHEENRSIVARYTQAGSLDPSFGRGGAVVNQRQTRAWAVVIQPDGRVVAAGSNPVDFALARYRSNGSVDASFGSGGTVTSAFGSLWTMLASMSATRLNGQVIVRWRTTSEGDARGFNVYRGQDGGKRRVNQALIRAKGTRGRGAAYTFGDLAPRSARDYWLEDVAAGGTRRWLGQAHVSR
jgi:uncharacterized delta-60 repeat protein